MKKTTTIFSLLWIIAIVLLTTLPMGLSPAYNGTIPTHRNQYELMAESLLKGHLYLDLPESTILNEMENPYDPQARKDLNAGVYWDGNAYRSYWDHAYYNGHFYMYFGVVPAIIVFLPYRIITGTPLTSYHATQLFTVLIIIGLFVLFDLIREKLCPMMSHFVFMALGSAFSLVSVWYFSTTPTLYCTAISSAVAMMVWSFYFYLSVFWRNLSPLKTNLFLVLAALLGALAFGCRPPVALSNFSMVFILFYIVKKNPKNIIPIAFPYLIIGIFLMLYNYARFDNPFEFGQAYQLTISDLTSYSLFTNVSLLKIMNGFITLFLQSSTLSNTFPYVTFSGILLEFPIYLIALGFFFFSEKIRKKLKKNNIFSTCIALLISIVLITYSVVIMTTYIFERYHSDFYFILSIFSFIIISLLFENVSERKKTFLNIFFVSFSALTLITTILLFFVPNDFNLTEYYPEILDKIRLYLPIIHL